MEETFAISPEKSSRVPDIMLAGTRVGLNYDGTNHLDLNSIVEATSEVERNPGAQAPEKALQQALRRVRGKAVDDIRRTREFAACNLTVFPVTKEDLYEPDAFDRLMAQVLELVAVQTGKDLRMQRRCLVSPLAKMLRDELRHSLLSMKARPEISFSISDVGPIKKVAGEQVSI
ncbi:MAG: hypothetical protein ACOX69_07980 [Coriobacteriales bacterium]|jgi:hypothetical protein